MNRLCKLLHKVCCLFVMLLFIQQAWAQSTTRIRGVVTDSITGEVMPLVNIFFPGTDVGVSTDFDGEYFLETNIDSLVLRASFVGYKTKNVRIIKGAFNSVDFVLQPEVIELSTVTVKPGVNPAFAILKHISENKYRNNPDNYDGYSCKTYTKMELDATNINPYFKNKKLQKNFGFVFQYMDTSAITGKAFLPVMITEGVSDYYYRSNPLLKREVVQASKISGVENDYSLSQFTGQLHQKANFYDNYIDLFEVRFVSPLCENGRIFYKYYLVDSTRTGGRKVYTMRFHPKSYSVPTFDGELRIDSTTWAVVSAKASLAKKLNINWIRHLVLSANYERINDTTWFPSRDEMFADFSVVQGDSSKLLSFLGRRQIDYLEPKLGTDFPQFVLKMGTDVVTPPDVMKKDALYWDTVRPYELSNREKEVFAMVDSVKNVPLFNTIYDVLETVLFGYYNGKYLAFGPYYKLYSYNGIEGSRFQFGMRTTKDFSTKWRFSTYAAYGTKDNKFKGGVGALYQFNTLPFSQLSLNYKKDMSQLGAGFNALTESNILSTALSKGDNDKLTPVESVKLEWLKEWKPGVNNTFGVTAMKIRATDKVMFRTPANDTLSSIKSSTINIDTRLSWNEIWVRSDFDKVGISSPYPRVGLNLSLGLNDVMKHDYPYLRAVLWSQYDFHIAPMGYSDFFFSAGKIFGKVPYPLLKLHEGNATYFYDEYAFSCMNFYEFASDEWASLVWEHHFRGFFLGKIPLLKKLKLREVLTYKVLIGSLSDKNNGANGRTNAILFFPDGMSSVGKPYMEGGIGIENILKIFRVDAIWRLTHRSQTTGVRHQNFAINVSIHLNF